MRITIVIACLNAAPTIERCLASIDSQDLDEVEVLVADGASTDGSAEIARNLAARSRKRIVVTSTPDKGIADAWNKILPRATGEWVLFLGADDCLAASTVLREMKPYLESAFPAHRVVYGKVAMMRSNGEVAVIIDRPWSEKDFRGCHTNLPHQAVFHHKSLFADHGRFDASLRVASDFDFLLRELMSHEPLYVPDVTVAKMQLGGLSTQRKHIMVAMTEQIRLHRRHVGGVSAFLRWHYVKALAIWGLFAIGGDRLALAVTNRYRWAVGRRPPFGF